MPAMRWWLLLTIVTTWASASPAEVAPFHDGRLVLRFGALYGLSAPSMQDPGLSGSLVVGRGPGGSLTRIEVPAGLFQGSAHVTLTAPALFPPAHGVELTSTNAQGPVSNGAGTFAIQASGTSTGFGGTMPLRGIHRVCLFFACDDPLVTNGDVHLDKIGEGGIASSLGIFRVAIAGRPWQTSSVTVDEGNGATQMVAGGVMPTPSGGTFVQLVTPLMISTNAVGPNDQSVPPVRGLGLLSLVVVPEPAETGLLAVAIGTLVWLGARRRDSKRLV